MTVVKLNEGEQYYASCPYCAEYLAIVLDSPVEMHIVGAECPNPECDFEVELDDEITLELE